MGGVRPQDDPQASQGWLVSFLLAPGLSWPFLAGLRLMDGWGVALSSSRPRLGGEGTRKAAWCRAAARPRCSAPEAQAGTGQGGVGRKGVLGCTTEPSWVFQVSERALSTNEPTGCPQPRPSIRQTDRQAGGILQPGKGKPQNGACHAAAWRAEQLQVCECLCVCVCVAGQPGGRVLPPPTILLLSCQWAGGYSLAASARPTRFSSRSNTV